MTNCVKYVKLGTTLAFRQQFGVVQRMNPFCCVAVNRAVEYLTIVSRLTKNFWNAHGKLLAEVSAESF